MRVFLVLLVATAAFVVAMLLSAAVSSPRGARAFRHAQRPVWLALLLLPAAGLQFACWRWQLALHADPRGWFAAGEARVSGLVLTYSGLVYALGYLLGGVPPRRGGSGGTASPGEDERDPPLVEEGSKR